MAGHGSDQPPSFTEANRDLPPELKRLLPLHSRLGKPEPGQWLAEHPEPGQTYAQYLAAQPRRVDAKHKVIYVQPLGEFDTAAQDPSRDG